MIAAQKFKVQISHTTHHPYVYIHNIYIHRRPFVRLVRPSWANDVCDHHQSNVCVYDFSSCAYKAKNLHRRRRMTPLLTFFAALISMNVSTCVWMPLKICSWSRTYIVLLGIRNVYICLQSTFYIYIYIYLYIIYIYVWLVSSVF